MFNQVDLKHYLEAAREAGYVVNNKWYGWLDLAQICCKSRFKTKGQAKNALRKMFPHIKPQYLYAAARDHSIRTAVRVQKSGKKPDQYKNFYNSWDWAQLRYEAIKKYGPVCMVCGASKADGAVINVDHIKPTRFFWDQRLDPNNLQILCALCNKGKSNKDTTDWRPFVPEQVMDDADLAHFKSI